MIHFILALTLNAQATHAISWQNYWRNVCERYLTGEDPTQYEKYSNHQLWVTFERLLQNDYRSSGIIAEAKHRLPLTTDPREIELLNRILR